MNNRDDADPTPDSEPQSPPPAEDAQTPTGSDHVGSDDPNSDTDRFPPVNPGPPGQGYTPDRHDTAQLEVPPDGFEPYAGGSTGDGPPPNVPSSAGPPVVPQRPRRRTGMIVAISVLSVLLLLVIAGAGSELYIRNKAKDCLEQSFGDVTGASTSVSLSKRPMLLQWASGTVPYVQVDTSNEGPAAMRLHARGNDIKSGDNSTEIGEITGTGYVPFARIMELAQPQQGNATSDDPNNGGGLAGLIGAVGGGMNIDSVTGDAAAGTISTASSFNFIVSIPAEVELRPVTTDGKLTFEVVEASAVGFGVPADWAQVLVDQISAGMFPPLFDQLTFDQLTVSDKGVEFAVAGDNVTLNQESVGADQSNDGGSCTVI